MNLRKDPPTNINCFIILNDVNNFINFVTCNINVHLYIVIVIYIVYGHIDLQVIYDPSFSLFQVSTNFILYSRIHELHW